MNSPLPSGLRFAKMQGAGNDFVVLDLRDGTARPDTDAIRALADRHFGIGCDQLMTIEADAEADARLRFYNPDGGEAGACGNATRCAALFLGGPTGQRRVLRTAAGLLHSELLGAGRVRVDMGPPRLDWQDIPLAQETDTLHLDLHDGTVADPVGCSMGNPHATFFVTDLDATDIATLGPRFEHHPLFPERANIGFAQITGPGAMRLRVWERGAGETLACGSGACAAGVAAIRRGLAEGAIDIAMPGGDLTVAWNGAGVLLSGPASFSFTGITP